MYLHSGCLNINQYSGDKQKSYITLTQTSALIANSWEGFIKDLTCPSSGTLARVFVKGQQGADTSVGTGVVWVARGVLRSLAVLSSVAKRAGAGGADWYRYTSWHRHRAVPPIQAVAGMTRVLVVAVFTQEAWCTPGHTQKHKKNQWWRLQRHTQGFKPNHPSIQTIKLKDETDKYVCVCLTDWQTNKTKSDFQSTARNWPHQTTTAESIDSSE